MSPVAGSFGIEGIWCDCDILHRKCFILMHYRLRQPARFLPATPFLPSKPHFFGAQRLWKGSRRHSSSPFESKGAPSHGMMPASIEEVASPWDPFEQVRVVHVV